MSFSMEMSGFDDLMKKLDPATSPHPLSLACPKCGANLGLQLKDATGTKKVTCSCGNVIEIEFTD